MKSVFSACTMMGIVFASLAGAQEADFPPPGPEHDRLKKMAGEWDTVTKSPMQSGETKGHQTAKMDVGGYFLFTDYKGEMMGKPFHGRGVTGYDSFQKKYVGAWVDSMSPAIYHIEAGFNESGNEFHEYMTGPGPDGKMMRFRSVIKLIDADHMHMAMFVPGPDGKEMQMMEIAFTRKK